MKSEADRFNELINFLEVGWEIEEPILKGVPASSNLAAEWARFYHFVLRRASGEHTRLVTVPDSHSLRQFLAANNFRINQL